MNASMWKAVAVALCFGLLGAGAAFAFARAEPAPRPHTKPTDEEWLPTKSIAFKIREPEPGEKPDLSSRPTAFPELREPDPLLDRFKRERQLRNLCPHLYGQTDLVIEPTDDPRRKLLKARLHQAALECPRYREIVWTTVMGDWRVRPQLLKCLADIRTTATELWAEQPQELISWLGEVVIVTKEWELYTLRRLLNGTDPPATYYYVRRHRLKAEAELWKVKFAK